MNRPTLLLALLALGCREKAPEQSQDTLLAANDADGDGFTTDTDCNDSDTAVNPDAAELCDGVDNNCDGEIDEGLLITVYDDLDADGYGDPGAASEVCSIGADQVDNADDCDDTNADSFPGAAERCDGFDNDCDGTVDNDLNYDWFADTDGDGFGDPAAAVSPASCDPGEGYVADNTDCDDTFDTVFPGADEVCDGLDNDCNAAVDDNPETWSTFYRDVDDDGYGDELDTVEQCDAPSGYVDQGLDCNDLDPAVNPGATEVCNDGVDDDCDGTADDIDADGDGYFDAACLGGDDCDDTVASTNPGAAEVWYDGVDQDCDGASDFDADGDAELSDAHGGTDCDDTDAAINTAAAEIWYDGVDQDCDGLSDYDADGDLDDSDAHGGGDCDDTDPSIASTATETWYDGVDQNCDGLSDYDADGDLEDSDLHGGTDCDDTDALVNTAATEVWYDGVDQDCDGASDFDADGDAELSDAHGGTDCDDTDAAINTAAAEIWYDGVDQDCDGLSDYDADGDLDDSDAHGGGDCDDTDPSIASTATETWYDGVDQNCDGLSDYDADGDLEDSDLHGGTDCVDQDCDGASDFDADGDGVDKLGEGGWDCDDTDASISPRATEVCDDGIDQDCDGTSDGCTFDGDVSVSTADFYVYGENDGDRLGQGDPGLANAGDIDGDGNDDLILGAIYNDDNGTNAGAAYIFLGPLSGKGINAGTADVTIDGAADNDLAGRAVVGVGDVDADGFDDVLISAQGDSTNGSNAGAAYLFAGPISGTGLTTASADARFDGAAAGDLVADVGWVGDVNNDGYDDVFIASQYYDATTGSDAGAATLIYGPVTADYDLGAMTTGDARFIGEAASDEAGSALWGGGDLNGDGVADLLIAARYNDTAGSNAGTVYVNFGPVSGEIDLSASDCAFTGESAGDEVGFGASVSNAGDINNDGYDDFLAGARFNAAGGTKAGAAYLIHGPLSSGLTASLANADAIFVGEEASDQTGDSVAGPGDVDGDGNDDVLIGSGWSDAGTNNGGAAYLMLGPVSGTVDLSGADARFLPEGDNDRIRVNAGGDLDGDGLGDILVGAQLNSSNSSTTNARHGAVYLFYGKGL